MAQMISEFASQPTMQLSLIMIASDIHSSCWGAVQELLEEWPQTVLKAYTHILELEGKFHQVARYLRFWGNRDDNWSHLDLVEQWLQTVLGGGFLKVRESLILHVRDSQQELGRLFLIHGHQGTR